MFRLKFFRSQHRENSTQNQLCSDSGKIISRPKHFSHTAGRPCGEDFWKVPGLSDEKIKKI